MLRRFRNVCHLVTLIVAGVGPSWADSDLVVLHVASFDRSTVTFYWCGHHMTSPVTFAIGDGRFVANGLDCGGAADTAGSALLGRMYAPIPRVTELMSAGHSPTVALNRYACELEDVARAAIRTYRSSQSTKSSSSASQPAVADLPTNMGIQRSSVRITKASFSCSTSVREFQFRYPIDVSDSFLTLPSCPPKRAPDLEEAKRVATSLGSTLQSPSACLIFGSPGGYKKFMGPSLDQVLEQIRLASIAFSRSGPYGVRTAVKHPLIPHETLIRICELRQGER